MKSQHLKSLLLGGLLFIFYIQVSAQTPHIVYSEDSTAISYEVYGKGDPTLVFIHGWSCDSRYWRNQIDKFSKHNRMVLIDLAGHGHSGSSRQNYTMEAFGEDVKTVVDEIGCSNVILIGHSMGGAVIAEAANLMPQRVKGLIGVDTFEDIEYPLNEDGYNMMLAPFQQNFVTGTQQFVQSMLLPTPDSTLQMWIASDMSAAPKASAISAMQAYLKQIVSGDAARVFDELNIPVVVVKSDMYPVNYEANRRHIKSFNAIEIEHADHFLMLNHSKEFNTALKKTINEIENTINE